jgi:hypothetical protein
VRVQRRGERAADVRLTGGSVDCVQTHPEVVGPAQRGVAQGPHVGAAAPHDVLRLRHKHDRPMP